MRRVKEIACTKFNGSPLHGSFFSRSEFLVPIYVFRYTYTQKNINSFLHNIWDLHNLLFENYLNEKLKSSLILFL